MEDVPHLTRPFVVAVATCLLVTPGASAKVDLTLVRACGPAACAEVRDKRVLDALRRLSSTRQYEFDVPPAVASYHVLRGPHDPTPYGAYVRSFDRRVPIRWHWVAAAPAWIDPGSRVRSKLSAVSRGVRPFRPPRPVRVIVDGRQAKPAAPYVRLLGDLQRRSRPRASLEPWITVTIIRNRPNPWTDASSMFYDRDDHALFRDGGWFHVPVSLRRMITSPLVTN